MTLAFAVNSVSWQPKRSIIPGMNQAQHCQLVKGMDCPPLLCANADSPPSTVWVLFWVPQLKKDRKLLDKIQMRVEKMMNDLEGKTYEDCLRSLGLFILEMRRLKGGLMVAYSSS